MEIQKLLSLIKSLTKSEKRYFKLTVKIENPKYLILYNTLVRVTIQLIQI